MAMLCTTFDFKQAGHVVDRLTRWHKNACCWLARLTSVPKKMPGAHSVLQALFVF